jgi:HK97 family phage major capsid protein
MVARHGMAARGTDTWRSLQERLSATPAGLSEQVPADGGFLVQPDLADEVALHLYQTGEFLSRVKRYITTKNGTKIAGIDEQSRANGSRWGGLLAYWQNESDSLTAKKPKFRLNEMLAKKLTGLCYASSELVNDSPLFVQTLTTAFLDEFKFRFEDAAFNGTGAGMPMGILNSPALITVAKQGGQSAATVVLQNILDMDQRMWPGNYAGACWFIHADVRAQLLKTFIGTSNSYSPVLQLRTSPDGYDMLLGHPMIVSEHCQALGGPGDIILCDPGEYAFLERAPGPQFATSIHVKYTTDEETLRFVWRVDGQPIWHQPLTPLNGTNTASPFIALAQR